MPILNGRSVVITCRGILKDTFTGREATKDSLTITTSFMAVSEDECTISLPKETPCHSIIATTRVFAVSYIDDHLKRFIVDNAKHLRDYVDAFEHLNIPKGECSAIDSCMLTEADICLECEVHKELDIGKATVFAAKILHTHEKCQKSR